MAVVFTFWLTLMENAIGDFLKGFAGQPRAFIVAGIKKTGNIQGP